MMQSKYADPNMGKIWQSKYAVNPNMGKSYRLFVQHTLDTPILTHQF